MSIMKAVYMLASKPTFAAAAAVARASRASSVTNKKVEGGRPNVQTLGPPCTYRRLRGRPDVRTFGRVGVQTSGEQKFYKATKQKLSTKQNF